MSVSVAMSSAACAQARSVWLSAAGNTRDCIEEAEHESIVATRIIVDAAGDAITKVCTGIMRSRSRDTHRAYGVNGSCGCIVRVLGASILYKMSVGVKDICQLPLRGHEVGDVFMQRFEADAVSRPEVGCPQLPRARHTEKLGAS